MKSLCIYSLGVLLIPFIISQSMAQNIHKCETTIKGGEYKWAGIDPMLKDPSSYFGFVLVKPKNINRVFLIELAKRLKKEYCEAEKFQVAIFDDRKYANANSLMDYTSSKGKIILMRGFYSFDRKAGKDLLEFSNKSGNPTTEVQIDLSALNEK